MIIRKTVLSLQGRVVYPPGYRHMTNRVPIHDPPLQCYSSPASSSAFVAA